jgi:hypothetical protein
MSLLTEFDSINVSIVQMVIMLLVLCPVIRIILFTHETDFPHQQKSFSTLVAIEQGTQDVSCYYVGSSLVPGRGKNVFSKRIPKGSGALHPAPRIQWMSRDLSKGLKLPVPTTYYQG